MISGTGFNRGRKSGVLILRFMLILATALLLLPPGFEGPVPALPTLIIALFFLSNVGLMAVPAARLLARRSDFQLVLADTFLVALGLFYANTGQGELPAAFFVVVLLAAMGRDVPRIVIGSTFVAGFYLFLTHRAGLLAGMPAVESLLRVPFLYISGLYYGSAVMRVRADQERASHLETERRDLETFLAVTAATTSSLHLHTVLNSIVQKVAHMVGAARCSIVLITQPEKECVVMASNDKPDTERMKLDLDKYPELRQAIETGETVVVNDASNDPMMEQVRHIPKKTGSRSILVVPLLFEKEMLGLLSVRAAGAQKEFSPREIKACQVVANASANALKNAILFEQMQEEAKRRKATSEVLTNIMEHFPDMIFMTDLQGTLIDLNRGGETLLGVTRDQVLGRPAASLFVGAEGSFNLESLRQRGGSVSGHQVLLRRTDGTLRHGIAAVAFLRGETGEPTGIVGVCKDLTELKKAQRQLQEAQNVSTLERISELAGDLSSPISDILGRAEGLIERPSSPDTVIAARQILESARECRKIAEKLQSWSRSQTLEQELVAAGPEGS